VVRQVLTYRSCDAIHLVERRDSNQNLQNVASTPDAVTRRVSLKVCLYRTRPRLGGVRKRMV